MNLESPSPLTKPHTEPQSPRIENPGWSRKLLAWSVHLFTATGAICCLLAMEAGIEQRWQATFTWLALAVVIDAVDGGFARAVRVKEILPNFKGDELDNIVDFANYVLVPAFLIHHAELLPPNWSWCCISSIALASSYQFCQQNAKTPDHFFRGFPSYWNVVVLYLLALDLPRVANMAIVVLLVVLVFVPIKYVYPSRTIAFRKLTLSLTSVWGIGLGYIVWQLPDPSQMLVRATLIYVLYYFGLSLYLAVSRSRVQSAT